jgi:Zn-dependent protease
MRDPMTWSIPLFRAFGIQVKLHILYVLITLVMLVRVYSVDKTHLAEFALIWVVMLFVMVLLHEFGHCFAARRVDGEADEILMWPLGGLAYVSVPHSARANLITAVGGPLVNVAICLAAAGALFAAGYLAPINVFQTRQLYYPELHNWKDGRDWKAYADAPYFVTQDGKHISSMNVGPNKDEAYPYLVPNPDKPTEWLPAKRTGDDPYPVWVLWTARTFWLSWMLLLFNLIPAFPLDGGRILQCILWGRSGDYRSATQVACWSGLITALVFAVLAFALNESLLLGLAIFMMFYSYYQLRLLDHGMEDAGAFGYDFSKGYGGFGPDEDAPAPKPRRVGPLKRWLQARRARKIQREATQRAADEARLDQLLDKIGQHGKESLTPEEKRFMDRVSARYRNRP